MIRLDLTGTEKYCSLTDEELRAAAAAHRSLLEGTGVESDKTGWLTLADRILTGECRDILAAAEKIKSDSKVLVVLGIGGSYLGARAAIEMLQPEGDVEILFAGNGLSPTYIRNVIRTLGDRDFSVNVISKSGTTMETSLGFRVFKDLLEKKYGEAEAAKRIYATTDAVKGALKGLSDRKGYTTFVVPDDVGGRFSVLSAVGLLPMAVAGIDIVNVLTVAARTMKELNECTEGNPAEIYAAVRQNLYRSGKAIEILACFEPCFRFMGEWWKQLYGESEGKDGKGLFPAYVEYTADLHSMGQMIQDGERNIVETAILFDTDRQQISVPDEASNADGFGGLVGRTFGDVCRVVADAVREAHVDGGVPNVRLNVEACDEAGFAQIVTFFELSCAISGYLEGVNPFNQPGVEVYKANMIRRLGTKK